MSPENRFHFGVVLLNAAVLAMTECRAGTDFGVL